MNRHFQPARRRAMVASAALFAASLLPMPAAFAQTAHKPKVALVMKSLANEFFLTMETGAKDYQKQNPQKFDLITNGIKDETDTADMTPGVNRDRFSVFSFQTHVVSEFPEGDAASKSRRWITLISAGWLPHYRGPPNEPAAI
jgi:hypothetical protein